MRKAIVISCLLLGTLYGHTQTTAPLTRFHFTQLTGGIILIDAQLDQFKDTLHFILDTGSGGISLDSATAVYLGLPLTPTNRTMLGVGGIKKLSFANNHTLRLPGLHIDSLNFHINNYELLSSVHGITVDGIIGYSFFKQFVVDINYDSLQISVYNPGTYPHPKNGFSLPLQVQSIPMSRISFTDEAPFQERFIVDYGAGLCLLLNNRYVSKHQLLANKKRYTTQAEGAGGKNLMELTYLKKVRIGNYTFRKVPVYLFDDEHNITSFPNNAGLLGSELLRRFNAVINYPEGYLYLRPNSHIHEPFDYAYTGMSFYVIEGNIQITDIIKGSPADKAGLQEGDMLVGVEKNFTHNIQTYKNLIQNADVTLQLFIQRNGTLMQIRLKTGSILR